MKESMYPIRIRATEMSRRNRSGFFDVLLERYARLQGRWRVSLGGVQNRGLTRDWWGKGSERVVGRIASSLSVRHILPREKRMSPFPERLSRSRYLHLGFHASISETREQIGRERKRERKREGESRLTGSSHAIRCILPTSYNSFFALLLVSRYTRSTASRTFRGRSSHYACPIHSILANGTKALEIASVFPPLAEILVCADTYANSWAKDLMYLPETCTLYTCT